MTLLHLPGDPLDLLYLMRVMTTVIQMYLNLLGGLLGGHKLLKEGLKLLKEGGPKVLKEGGPTHLNVGGPTQLHEEGHPLLMIGGPLPLRVGREMRRNLLD